MGRYECTSATDGQPRWVSSDDVEEGLICDWPDDQEAIVLGDPGGTALVVVGTREELRQLAAQLAAVVASDPPPPASALRCERCQSVEVNEGEELCAECPEGNSGRVVL